MTDQPSRLNRYLTVAVATVLLGMLLGLTWYSGTQRAAQANADLRERLFCETMALAETINPDVARKLTFTTEDEGNPAYEVLCERMTQLDGFSPPCRVYSLALRGGTLLFGPGNHSLSNSASSPGAAFKRIPQARFQIFEDTKAFTIGPYRDEHGSFVSAFAPVIDPLDGHVIMIVGVDVLVDNWESRVNNARSKPYWCTSLLMILLVVCAFAVRRHDRHFGVGSIRISAGILKPIALALIGGLLILWGYQYWQYREKTRRTITRIADQIKGDWNQTLAGDVLLLKVHADQIMANPVLLKAWMDKDREALAALSKPILEQMKSQYGIGNLGFIEPDRTVFFRAHPPGGYGDTNLLFALTSAMRTEEDSWGVELGPTGAFTLRYVKPWLRDGRPIGYLVIGMEIEHLIEQLTSTRNVEYLTVLKKPLTPRDYFEAGRVVHGYAGQWATYPDFVTAQQSIPEISPKLATWLERHAKGSPIPSTMEVRLAGKQYACGLVHLPDAMGREVADLIVMQDVSCHVAVARSDLALSVMMSFVLFGSILGVFWAVILSAERQIGAAFEKVRENGLLYKTLFDTLAEGVVLIGLDGRILQANPAAERMLNLTQAEILKRPIYGPQWKAFRLDGITPMPPEERASFRAIKERCPVRNTEMGVSLPDGSLCWVNINAAPILKPAGQVEGVVTTITDITLRKQADDAARLHSEILLNLAEGVFLVRVDDGTIVFANSQFERMFGYEPGEMIGKSVCIVNPPGEMDPESFAKVMTEVIVRDGHWSGEVRNIRKDGSLFWSRAVVSTFTHPQHGPIMVAVHEDITERKRLEADLLAVSTLEKQRLGRDLHDGVAQQIAATVYLCHALIDNRLAADQRTAIEKIEALLQNSVMQIRNVAHALSPTGLEELGLAAVLQRLIAQIAQSFCVNARLEQTGASVNADHPTATHLYYLIHEAMMNAVRHGRARNILVTLFWSPEACERASVEDDGCGFDPEAACLDGMGLRSMRHRAHQLGGQLTVESTKDKGTRIVFERRGRHA